MRLLTGQIKYFKLRPSVPSLSMAWIPFWSGASWVIYNVVSDFRVPSMLSSCPVHFPTTLRPLSWIFMLSIVDITRFGVNPCSSPFLLSARNKGCFSEDWAWVTVYISTSIAVSTQNLTNKEVNKRIFWIQDEFETSFLVWQKKKNAVEHKKCK